jgi:site-specific DNA-methyltransferase (adenine-specific)
MSVSRFNMDCFDCFPLIKEKSIDLCILDLPYSQTACKWDIAIDLDKMWIELKRICTKKCIYVFFCTTKFGVSIINSNPKWFRYDLVWEKSKKVGFLSANKMPLRKHEMMYVMGNPQGTHKTYNPQKVSGKPYTHKGRLTAGSYGLDVKPIPTINEGMYHPDSILKIPTHEMLYVMGDPKETHKTYNPQKELRDKVYTNKRSKKCQEKTEIWESKTKIHAESTYTHRHPTTILEFKNPYKPVHRTQKSVKLIEWLINSYSNKGDMVLDFTAGSGTTGIACMNTDRKCILVEMDTDIFKIMEKRIKEHKII